MISFFEDKKIVFLFLITFYSVFLIAPSFYETNSSFVMIFPLVVTLVCILGIPIVLYKNRKLEFFNCFELSRPMGNLEKVFLFFLIVVSGFCFFIFFYSIDTWTTNHQFLINVDELTKNYLKSVNESKFRIGFILLFFLTMAMNEFVFRKFLFPLLFSGTNSFLFASVVVSAIGASSESYFYLPYIAFSFIFSLELNYLYFKTRSLFWPIIMHFVFDFCTLYLAPFWKVTLDFKPEECYLIYFFSFFIFVVLNLRLKSVNLEFGRADDDFGVFWKFVVGGVILVFLFKVFVYLNR